MKYAVDFDSTLAVYHPGDFHKYGPLILGEPIEPMVNQVKAWLRQGIEVVIFTARDPISWALISKWTEEHIGTRLMVTNVKTWDIDAFYDDKTFHVIPNTGEIVDTDLYLQYKAFWLEKGN